MWGMSGAGARTVSTGRKTSTVSTFVEAMRPCQFRALVHRTSFQMLHMDVPHLGKSRCRQRSCTCHPACGHAPDTLCTTCLWQGPCTPSSKADSFWPAEMTWQHALSGQATITGMLVHGQRLTKALLRLRTAYGTGSSCHWTVKSVLQSIIKCCRPLTCKECTAAHQKCCSHAHSGQNLCQRMHLVQQIGILRAKSAASRRSPTQWSAATRLSEERLQQLEVLRQLSRLGAGPQEPHAPQAARLELHKGAVGGAQAPPTLLPHLHYRRDLTLSSIKHYAAALSAAVRRLCRASAPGMHHARPHEAARGGCGAANHTARLQLGHRIGHGMPCSPSHTQSSPGRASEDIGPHGLTWSIPATCSSPAPQHSRHAIMRLCSSAPCICLLRRLTGAWRRSGH